MEPIVVIEQVLTQMDSLMLFAIVGGLLGLGLQRVLGIFIKPNYYPAKVPTRAITPHD